MSKLFNNSVEDSLETGVRPPQAGLVGMDEGVGDDKSADDEAGNVGRGRGAVVENNGQLFTITDSTSIVIKITQQQTDIFAPFIFF